MLKIILIILATQWFCALLAYGIPFYIDWKEIKNKYK